MLYERQKQLIERGYQLIDGFRETGRRLKLAEEEAKKLLGSSTIGSGVREKESQHLSILEKNIRELEEIEINDPSILNIFEGVLLFSESYFKLLEEEIVKLERDLEI